METTLKLAGALALTAGALLTVLALIAPAPFVGILIGPALIAAGVASIESTPSRRRQRAAARRRDRRRGYLV